MMKVKILNCLMLLFLSLAAVSCGSDDDEPENYAEMRGYWVCDQSELALEIISTREYNEMKGNSHEGENPNDNVYQLWTTESYTPQLWVSWTSVISGKMSFFTPDYKWRDEVVIQTISNDRMVLEGYDIYQFRRVSKSEFNSLVGRM